MESKSVEIVTPESVFAGDLEDDYPVNAKKLHEWLGVESQFRDWIARRIADYGFSANSDYCASFESRHSGRGKPKEYRLSLSMAKELAMVERTAKGREIRQYFIACEDRLKKELKIKKGWTIAREEGKYARRVETDVIKSFVEYAKRQGSESADLYYLNFSKMVNAALLELDGGKSPGRDQLNIIQLHAISVAENVVARTLVQCMTSQLPYKDVYRIAKEKIAKYAESVGKTRPGINARESVGLIA